MSYHLVFHSVPDWQWDIPFKQYCFQNIMFSFVWFGPGSDFCNLDTSDNHVLPSDIDVLRHRQDYYEFFSLTFVFFWSSPKLFYRNICSLPFPYLLASIDFVSSSSSNKKFLTTVRRTNHFSFKPSMMNCPSLSSFRSSEFKKASPFLIGNQT